MLFPKRTANIGAWFLIAKQFRKNASLVIGYVFLLRVHQSSARNFSEKMLKTPLNPTRSRLFARVTYASKGLLTDAMQRPDLSGRCMASVGSSDMVALTRQRGVAPQSSWHKAFAGERGVSLGIFPGRTIRRTKRWQG
jgi:hypothetical protein